ncbi:sulfatase-like hydrolase/transferase [Opitutales bacterium]|nr:sulfatase-like hydrolase/transferase [Opitutales bacterium]
MDQIAPTSSGTNRVRTLLLSVLFLFCAQAPVCFAQPNVIVIICDDLNDSVDGMGGHPQAYTPNIERLMDQGVRFTNAHCNAPICGPSRASLWTGLLPSTSGFYGYDQQKNDWRDFDILDDAVTLMEHFKANSYNVWGSGKIFHNGHEDNSVFSVNPAVDGAGPSDFGPFPWDGATLEEYGAPKGYQHPDMPTNNWGYYPSTTSLDNNPGDTPGYESYQWALKDGSTYDYTSEGGPIGIEGDVRDPMPDEISAQWAENKLGQTDNSPFLMIVGMNRPHSPFYAPKEFFDLFRDANGNNTVSLPPHLPNLDDLADLPEIALGRPGIPASGQPLRGYQSGMDKYKRDYGNGANEWWLNFVQGYLACVAFADHQVGVIWDALQASDYANNTIVIVTSDHGYHLGEKDHSSKTTPWEETTRVPLVIYTPEMRPGGSLESVAGVECGAPVSLIDLYPTLNALCGMPADPNGGVGKNNMVLDGNDLTSLLEAPLAGQWDGPSVSLSHLHNARVAWPEDTKSPWALNHHAARSENYRYIRYSDGSEELYDHSIDPNEWTNEAANAAYAPAKAVMKQRLFKSLGLANTENLVANGSFESDLNNWVATGSAVASLNTSDSLAGDRSVLVTSNGTVSGGAFVDYQFDDANGTAVKDTAVNNGTSAASWNFGVGTVQAGNLNYGYSQYYKWTQVDTGAGTVAYRTLAFADTLTASDMTQYSFTVDFSKWDLRQAWDTNNDSAADKGIQITLDSTSGNNDNQAIFGFKTQGTNGFHAYSQGQGSSFAQAFGSSFDTDGDGAVSGLSRFEAAGGLLQINGDLSAGTWIAQAKTGEDGADWVTLGNGTGLTTISSIVLAAKSPAIGSWGGGDTGTIYSGDATAGGTTGDYMSIDSITLTNTISTSDGGLEQNMLAVLEPGKSYHISAWARSSSSGAVQLDMRETNGSGQATDVAIGSVAANNTEFLLIEGDYTVPDNLTGLSLVAQGASFSLDHVQVYEYQTPNIVASVVMDDGDGSISLGWNAELGVSYRLEQSLDLANGWTVLESNLTADKSNMIWDLMPDPAVSRAFWRVIKNP